MKWIKGKKGFIFKKIRVGQMNLHSQTQMWKIFFSLSMIKHNFCLYPIYFKCDMNPILLGKLLAWIISSWGEESEVELGISKHIYLFYIYIKNHVIIIISVLLQYSDFARILLQANFPLSLGSGLSPVLLPHLITQRCC